MKKILIICGPTATGKTALAIKMAQKFNGEIISADSRQVYKHMDIGTGKEWGPVTIWGYDMVAPTEEFSVAEYSKRISKVIDSIWLRNKLPIIAGGTGLYIKSLVEGIGTANIPKNNNLRETLNSKSVEELFDQLATLDSTKAASLNTSDAKNPRRLIRAIEVAIWKIENAKEAKREIVKSEISNNSDILWVGLTMSKDDFERKIINRVERRIEEGFIDEVEELLRMGVSWKMQSMKSLGYRDSEAFFKNGLTYEEFVQNWVNNELKYVKRQMTWFKKNKRIIWFDVKDSDYKERVEKYIERWHNSR